MPRRTWTYDANMGWSGANFFSTMGAYLLGLGVIIYVVTLVWSGFRGRVAGPDPWDARTLEWSIPSPPPDYNFAAIPTVHARDAWWYEKHHPEETAREQNAHVRGEGAGHGGIHMPDRSWYPIVSAGALLAAGLFFAVSYYPAAIGAVVVMAAAVYLWSLEGPGGYHVHPESAAGSTSGDSKPPAVTDGSPNP
jgi:cytochrome c oxidase subunit 1